MTRSTKKKSARAKAKPATRRARPRLKTGGKTGAVRARTPLKKNSNGEPPDETRFQKGESGNPNGRPRGASLQAAIRRLADVPLPPDATRSYVEGVALALWKKALRGDVRAIRIVLERIDGKVSQPIELENVTLPSDVMDAIDKVYGKRTEQAEE